jgi:glutamyl-tRNA synthetase
LIQHFDFDHVGTSNGVWNPEKLSALNQHWLKQTPPAELAALALPFLAEAGLPGVPADARLARAAQAFAPRVKSLVELAAAVKPYLQHGVALDPAAAARHLDASGRAALAEARAHLEGVASWTQALLDPVVDLVAAKTGFKKGAVAQPIRVAVTGGTTSPGIGETLEVLGREEALYRIAQALAAA